MQGVKQARVSESETVMAHSTPHTSELWGNWGQLETGRLKRLAIEAARIKRGGAQSLSLSVVL